MNVRILKLGGAGERQRERKDVRWLSKIQESIFSKGKGNLEARVTGLEWMAAGMLGLCFDATNEVNSNSFVK